MIIKQTTTLIFQYPQDYIQEQEWLKDKTNMWVHKGTDTLCSIYESDKSYSIEPQTKRPCENCQEFDCYGCDYKQTERSEHGEDIQSAVEQ